MKPGERDPLLYLKDMLLSMERVNEYILDFEFNLFKRDYKTVDAVVRNFEIIGEASKNVPREIKELYDFIPWEEMYRLRNRIAHEYFGLDYEIIWDIATRQLPKNYVDLKAAVEDLERSADY
ncbi:MAG: DUF86 domain-containing protein [Bacteroidota bacterium]